MEILCLTCDEDLDQHELWEHNVLSSSGEFSILLPNWQNSNTHGQDELLLHRSSWTGSLVRTLSRRWDQIFNRAGWKDLRVQQKQIIDASR